MMHINAACVEYIILIWPNIVRLNKTEALPDSTYQSYVELEAYQTCHSTRQSYVELIGK